jgi:NAD(P)-dependent dehydrogenase (short-subunit alcohol dehydrogenase family)
MEQLMQKAFDHFGQIDVLVNNAGIGPKQIARTADADLTDWDNVIAVNQSGVFYGMKYVLPFMVQQGQGNIINIASLAGQVASPNNIAYSASKFAVVGMTKTTALEYGRKNIRVNAVCPGYTETNLLQELHNAKPELKEGLRAAAPMNRYGKVEEIAEAVLWLASDKSSFITGQTITLDGGISL